MGDLSEYALQVRRGVPYRAAAKAVVVGATVNTQAIMIDGVIRARIDRLLQLTKEKPITLEWMRAYKNGHRPHIAQYPDFTIWIPFGYTVIFTQLRAIDPRTGKNALSAHMSVRLDNGDELPHPCAVSEILRAFKLNPEIEAHRLCWIENERAVNILSHPRPE